MQTDEESSARRDLALARRIVVKIGTATVTRPKHEEEVQSADSGTAKRRAAGRAASRVALRDKGGVDTEYLHRVAAQISDLSRAGKEIILVTSGAIGMGARELGLSRRVTEVRMRQACAAIGQPLLMDEYRRAFGVFGLATAQILVTRESWDSREAYLNLRATVETLLEEKVVPVFNENDTLSTAEIGNAFGDNDRLSAYVASKIDADALLILSDVDALYTADPRENPDAKPIPYVRELGPELLAAAGGRGTEFSTGGMKTKLAAVSIARDANCRVVVAHGREPSIIARVLAGEALGTLFDAEPALKNRLRWLKNSSPQGSIGIDSGALAAIRARKSLLPSGLTAVRGNFPRGAVISVSGIDAGKAETVEVAKLISTLSAEELRSVMGKRSAEVESILGKEAGHIIARPEDTVFLDD
jgi:glutamate 5-kinase